MMEENERKTSSGPGRFSGAWHRVKPWIAAGLLTLWISMILYSWLFLGQVTKSTGEVLVLTLGGYFFIDLLGELFDGG